VAFGLTRIPLLGRATEVDDRLPSNVRPLCSRCNCSVQKISWTRSHQQYGFWVVATCHGQTKRFLISDQLIYAMQLTPETAFALACETLSKKFQPKMCSNRIGSKLELRIRKRKRIK